MSTMKAGLFLAVNELVGDAVVQGTVRRVEYRDGALTIRGLDLSGAMALLGALATPELVTAKLSGIMPSAPPVAATQAPPPPVVNTHTTTVNNAPRAPSSLEEAEVRWSYETAPRNGLLCSVCGTPQAESPSGAVCAKGHGGVEGVEPPRSRAEAPSEPSGAPAATATPAPPAEAPVAPAAVAPPAAGPAVSDLPEADEELAAFKDITTLRPLIGFLHDKRGVRGLDAMVDAIKRTGPVVKLVAKIMRDTPAELSKRTERTMTTLEIL